MEHTVQPNCLKQKLSKPFVSQCRYLLCVSGRLVLVDCVVYWTSGWHCEWVCALMRVFVPCALIRNKPNTWQRGRLIDRKRLKERCVYSHNCNKAQQSKYVFGKISSEFKNSRNIHFIKIYQLIRLSRLEILNAFSNPNIDIRILAQGYCVAFVSLSLLWTWQLSKMKYAKLS